LYTDLIKTRDKVSRADFEINGSDFFVVFTGCMRMEWVSVSSDWRDHSPAIQFDGKTDYGIE